LIKEEEEEEEEDDDDDDDPEETNRILRAISGKDLDKEKDKQKTKDITQLSKKERKELRQKELNDLDSILAEFQVDSNDSTSSIQKTDDIENCNVNINETGEELKTKKKKKKKIDSNGMFVWINILSSRADPSS
jgi:hypothetical protein